MLVDVAWDGVIGDKIVVAISDDAKFVKVAEASYTVDEYAYMSGISKASNGKSISFNYESLETGDSYVMSGSFAIVVAPNIAINGINFPEAGIYVMQAKVRGELVYVSKLTGGMIAQIPSVFVDLTKLSSEVSDAQYKADRAYNNASSAQTTAQTAQTTANNALALVPDANPAYGLIGAFDREKAYEKMTLYFGWTGGASLDIQVANKTSPTVTFTPPVYVDKQADFAFSRASSALPHPKITEIGGIVMYSNTPGSTKKFLITVDDTGALTATEVTT